MLEDARGTISDSLEFRQEQKQLLDICVYDEGLKRIVEFPKAPPALRNTMLKIVSGLACYTRLDLALSWIFDRISIWETSVNEANKDREWKKWLLKLLKQVKFYIIMIYTSLMTHGNNRFWWIQQQINLHTSKHWKCRP
jgi:hypothetical protein